MSKTNFSTNSEIYSQIASQSKKVEFLDTTIKMMKADSPLSAHIEMSFVEYGFNDLFERIKSATKDVIIGILEEQFQREVATLKNLMEQAR